MNLYLECRLTLSFCRFLRDGFSWLSLSEEDDWERHRDLLCLTAPDDGETVLTVGWTIRSTSAVDICDVTVGTKGEYRYRAPIYQIHFFLETIMTTLTIEFDFTCSLITRLG